MSDDKAAAITCSLNTAHYVNDDRAPASAPINWLLAFILIQFACQGLLTIDGLGGIRILLRMAAFVSSIVLLLCLRRGGNSHPTKRLVCTVIAITCCGILHPSLNSLLAGLASIALTIAVWSPLIWVTRFPINSEAFARILAVIWAFNSLSALVGVLQIYDPQRFAPDPAFLRALAGTSIDGLLFQLDDGRLVFRPMGLSDSPGGAAMSGQIAILAGMGVLLLSDNFLLRATTILTSAIGMFCIYICQMRSTLIVTLISLLGIVAMLSLCGRIRRAAGIAGVIAIATIGGFIWVTSVGSNAVASRLNTLIERPMGSVYYSNRGHFLEQTFAVQLPEFPFGAGLGRWGMMNTYFGDHTDPYNGSLWAEIQPTAWLFDGGLPLIVAGYCSMLGICWVTFRITVRPPSVKLGDMAAVVTAMNMGYLASTLGAPVFCSQMGLMFCVLNAAIFAASTRTAADT